MAQYEQVQYLELQEQRPIAGLGALLAKELYVTFDLELPESAEKLQRIFPRDTRYMIRKAQKNGMQAIVDNQAIDTFYEVYSRSFHNLGTPVFSKRLFQILLEEFGERCEITTVWREGQALASVVSFRFKDWILPYFGGSLIEGRQYAANNFMYWEVMKRALEMGIRHFDFGRSKLGSGSYTFKTQWNMRERPLPYQFGALVRRKAKSAELLSRQPKVQVRIFTLEVNAVRIDQSNRPGSSAPISLDGCRNRAGIIRQSCESSSLPTAFPIRQIRATSCVLFGNCANFRDSTRWIYFASTMTPRTRSTLRGVESVLQFLLPGKNFPCSAALACSLSVRCCGGNLLRSRFFVRLSFQRKLIRLFVSDSTTEIVVFGNSSSMAKYAEASGNIPRILDLVDVDSDKWLQYAKNSSWPWSWLWRREANLLGMYESSLVRDFSTTVVCTAAEAQLLRAKASPRAGSRCFRTFSMRMRTTPLGAPFQIPFEPGSPISFLPDPWITVRTSMR